LAGLDVISHFLPALSPGFEPLVLRAWSGRRAMERFYEDEWVGHFHSFYFTIYTTAENPDIVKNS
jgi:hypothetical protein